MARKKERKRPPTGKYDVTATIADITYPKDGILKDDEEIRLEIEDRPYEKEENLAYGTSPLGIRRTGKKFINKKQD